MQLFLDLTFTLRRIVCALDLTTICSLHTAFDGKRSPVTGRPRDLEVESAPIDHAATGYAIAFAHDHGKDRHAHLKTDVARSHTFAQNRVRLGLEPHHESRNIREENERNVEHVAQLDEVA